MDPHENKFREKECLESAAAGPSTSHSGKSDQYPTNIRYQDARQRVQPTAPPVDMNEDDGDYQEDSHVHPPQGEVHGAAAFQDNPQQYPHQYAQQPAVPAPQGQATNPTHSRHVAIKVQEKSLLEAYILWFPLGILGFHQFYLGRIGMGFLYMFTLGLFGIGWLFDLFLLPSLVRKTNEKRRRDAERGYVLYAGPYQELEERSLCIAYLFWLPPVGILGGHHYYLGRIGYGLAYTFTLGLFGFGWLIDLFRMHVLTRRTNKDIHTLRSGQPLSKNPGERMHLDDAYLLAFPLGFLGLHHFYMRRWLFGMVYFVTLGCLGVGVVVDLFRLPCLLNRTKRELATGDKKFHIDDAYVLWFPFGLAGAHHFYLSRLQWGFAYFFTFGFFGIGWLIDLCRIPFLVKKANDERQIPAPLLPAAQSPPSEVGQHGHVNTDGSGGPHSAPRYPNNYGTTAPSYPQGNVAVYAFPLDQHGNPIWTDGVTWDDSQHPGRVINQGPVEPPPPYSE